MFSMIPSDANDPQGLLRRYAPNNQFLKDMCAQQILKSVWAAAQSDQSLCNPLEESICHEFAIEPRVMNLI